MSERIQKYLARLGYGSRRQIEKRLKAGEIADRDGVPYRVGQLVGSSDIIVLDGVPITEVQSGAAGTRVIAYNKPEGEVSTVSDPENRATIYDRLPDDLAVGKWISVGRLDINSTGLILFSNDGELVHALTHPSSELQRVYRCRVWGNVSKQKLKRLRNGVRSKRDTLRFDSVRFINSAGGSNSWFEVTLRRGKNREIRRAWEAVDCKVNRLIRTQYASVCLPKDLPEGCFRELKQQEIDMLRKSIKL